VRDLFGDGTGGLNGAYLLDPQNVFRGASVSQLVGGGASDWFWIGVGLTAADQVNRVASGDVVTFA
jgi:hypothetical protein